MLTHDKNLPLDIPLRLFLCMSSAVQCHFVILCSFLYVANPPVSKRDSPSVSSPLPCLFCHQPSFMDNSSDVLMLTVHVTMLTCSLLLLLVPINSLFYYMVAVYNNFFICI